MINLRFVPYGKAEVKAERENPAALPADGGLFD